MTRVITLEKAPYDADGNLLTFIPSWVQVFWAPNEPFAATLRITSTERGMSAARFVAEDIKTGVRYTIFMTDMLEIIQERKINHGKVSGTWLVRKRGQNYGLALAP